VTEFVGGISFLWQETIAPNREAKVWVPIPRSQPRIDGPACVMGIGIAVPLAEFLQSEYHDFFFNVANTSGKEAISHRNLTRDKSMKSLI
jgi:hypothetical protein